MASHKTKILFISHDATRTGAPILLLHLLRYIQNKNISIHILLRAPGALEKTFFEVAKTKYYFLRQGLIMKIARLLRVNRLVERLHHQLLIYRYTLENFDLIYSNTIANGKVLKSLSTLKRPVITHVHELDKTIDHYGPANWQSVREHTDHYIAPSQAVRDNLVSRRAIPEEDIDVVHEFIPAFPDISIQDCRNRIRSKLGIPSHAFVVCGSGLCGPRKGTDLFVHLAKSTFEKCPDDEIFFLWVGGWPENNRDKAEVDQLLEISNLEEKILFTGEVVNPLDYYSAADIFTLVSREDPFPLVCLLAASVGKPILCFNDAGGMPEFVQDDSGYVVPYLDVDAMADRISYMLNNPDDLHKRSLRAREKVQQEHDIAVGAERICQIIERILENR